MPPVRTESEYGGRGTSRVIFSPGQTIVRRYFRLSTPTWVQPMTVVADDDRGLVLWSPVGGEFLRLRDADDRDGHQLRIDQMRDPGLVRTRWQGNHILVLMPPDAAHSVWWFFDTAGTFLNWYVNLEEPAVRWRGGIDTSDQDLDIVVAPDLSWTWKDEAEFAARTGHEGYWDAIQAAEIRAEGEQMVERIEAGRFPFDGSWCGFRPDPGWQPPALPADWGRARAT